MGTPLLKAIKKVTRDDLASIYKGRLSNESL